MYVCLKIHINTSGRAKYSLDITKSPLHFRELNSYSNERGKLLTTTINHRSLAHERNDRKERRGEKKEGTILGM